jgi:hypothetical protein
MYLALRLDNSKTEKAETAEGERSMKPKKENPRQIAGMKMENR